MIKKISVAIFLFALYSGSNAQLKMNVDLILINGKVCTVDQKFNYAEAFAVKNGSFIAIGSTEQMLKHYYSDSIVDAKWNPVYPGFIDAHSHFFGYALSLRELDLTGIRSFREIIDLLIKLKKPIMENGLLAGDGTRIFGRIKNSLTARIWIFYFLTARLY